MKTQATQASTSTELLRWLDESAAAGRGGDWQERVIARGGTVAWPGAGRDDVFVVRQGRVRVHMSNGRRELTLLYLEAGDVFSTHTPAQLSAVTAVRLACMPTRSFAGQLREGGSPALVAVMRVLGRLLAHTIGLVEDLAFREVHERLARLLVALVRRQGVATPHEGWRCTLPLNLTELAGVLGTSRQTVSTAFGDLERRGIVRRDARRQFRVPDLAALEALTGKVSSS